MPPGPRRASVPSRIGPEARPRGRVHLLIRLIDKPTQSPLIVLKGTRGSRVLEALRAGVRERELCRRDGRAARQQRRVKDADRRRPVLDEADKGEVVTKHAYGARDVGVG